MGHRPVICKIHLLFCSGLLFLSAILFVDLVTVASWQLVPGFYAINEKGVKTESEQSFIYRFLFYYSSIFLYPLGFFLLFVPLLRSMPRTRLC